MKKILKCIPHRYPFLLIDRIKSYKHDNHIQVIKNITVNDPWLQGHFPNKFIFPGVLMLESIAQSAIILALLKYPEYQNTEGFYCITGINNAKFKKIVIPGDQLIINVNIIKEHKSIIFFRGTIYVDNDVVCFAEITCKYILNI
ncbi:3-hydroxyacyl-[acyl-carrier-protein] dehydratase FabZ [Buchnera aphidicola (Takecallis arundicolens)]|uniref:3-hydroxyacyl-ACP dehydratase FabZ n=1 Tax=Buchnera aphidicola TaxID=9 RepID=UPI0034643643